MIPAVPELSEDPAARILEVVLRSPEGITRAELERETTLTLPSVSRAVSGLLRLGLVREAGQRPKRIEPVTDAVTLAGVHIDDGPREGCLVHAATVNLVGEVVSAEIEQHVPTPNWGDVVEAVARTIEQLSRADSRISAAGVAVGGFVDSSRGIVHQSPNLGWNDPVHLGPTVEAHCGVRTFVQNDANALALHDRLHGAGQDLTWFVSILMGRGIGAGLFLGTEVVDGQYGRAGELGHVRVTDELDNGECSCGQSGCLEMVAGSRNVVERAKTLAGPEHAEPATITDVARLADADPGGPLGSELARCGSLFGTALANLCAVCDPKKVLIHHTGLLESRVFRDAMDGELSRQLISTPEPPHLAEPIRLEAADILRGASAGALLNTLRAHRITGLLGTPAKPMAQRA